MKPLGREMASLALLAAWLTGCSNLHAPFHQQAQAPPLQTGNGSLDAREKKLHQPPPPLPPVLAQTASPALPPAKQRKVKRGRRTKRKESSEPESTTQEASNNAPAGAASSLPVKSATSAIGQLTAGDSATEAQTKRDTGNLIAETKQGLAAIKRTLSKEEQTTAGQIRTFLNQAEQALQNGDSDGAHTLATKAKLLLDELTKQ